MVYFTVAWIISTLELAIHLKTLFKELKGVTIVACLQITLSELVQNESVVVSGFSDVLEELTVHLECICEVLKSLLVSLESKISFSKLCVSNHKEKE